MTNKECLGKILQQYQLRKVDMLPVVVAHKPGAQDMITDYLRSQSVEYKTLEGDLVCTMLSREQLSYVAGLEITDILEIAENGPMPPTTTYR